MPTRELGRTGERVSIIGVGGYHIGDPDERTATRIMHEAIDAGINFFDNCWDYHEGDSERRMGEALADGRRQRVFLMTKIDGRTKAAAAEQIDQSLSRLKTDVVDLMQIHEVIRDNDAERVFAPGGAIEALVAAQKAGKIRYIGFTGHKHPDIHLKMLETAERSGFRFDAVQMPLNAMDAHYESFEKKVLPVLKGKGIGVLGMKSLGGGILLESGAVSARECLRYALSLDTDVVITGMESLERLEQAVSVARHFAPMSPDERRELLARTQNPAGKGEYEKFKTSDLFDATERNRHWLDTARM